MEHDFFFALAEYAAIVKGVSEEYDDTATISDIRAEHPELDFLDDDEITDILCYAVRLRCGGKLKMEFLSDKEPFFEDSFPFGEKSTSQNSPLIPTRKTFLFSDLRNLRRRLMLHFLNVIWQ